MRVMRLRPMEMGTLGPRRDWEEQILRFFGVDTLTMCDLIRSDVGSTDHVRVRSDARLA